MNTVIFADQNEIPLILSVLTASAGTKRITVIAPRLPVPFGFGSVDISPTAEGVRVREANSERKLMDLPCDIGEVERLWTYLLPLFSRAYVEGDSDGRDAIAAAVTAMVTHETI